MTELVFRDGKARLDYCYQCYQRKAVVKKSQAYKQPLTCGVVDYWGELVWEAERHKFVVSEKKYIAEVAEEKAWLEQNESPTNKGE